MSDDPDLSRYADVLAWIDDLGARDDDLLACWAKAFTLSHSAMSAWKSTVAAPASSTRRAVSSAPCFELR